ncbi:hypothetical protein [Ewingella americana]|jgi:uncharacterized membrane protein
MQLMNCSTPNRNKPVMRNFQSRSTSRTSIIVQAMVALVIIAYPFGVWFGVARFGISVLAPLLCIVFLLRLLTARVKAGQLWWVMTLSAAIGLVLSASSALLNQSHLLLYYPVAVNSLLLLVFAASLRSSSPIIERLARLRESQLPPAAIVYTRRVTQIWCVFFFFNGLVALYTCLKGDMALWAFYNGGLSYALIGVLMGGEWIVRKCILRV